MAMKKLLNHGYTVNTILESEFSPVDNNKPEETKANSIKVLEPLMESYFHTNGN